MSKMTTQDLEGIRSAHKERLAFKDKTYLLICGGTGWHATGSIRVKDALLATIEEKGLGDRVQVIETGCNGFCAMGPLLVVHPGDVFYQKLSVEDMPELVESHLINGKPVERLLYKDPVSKTKIAAQTKIPFFAHQMPRALRNKGLINPESIDEYIGLPPPAEKTTWLTQLAHWQDCPLRKCFPSHSFAVFTILDGNTPDCRTGRRTTGSGCSISSPLPRMQA